MPALVVLNEDAVPKTYTKSGEPGCGARSWLMIQRGRRGCRCHSLRSGTSSKREGTVMGFSAKQVQALRRNIDHRHVRTREAHGRELSYVEGWYAIFGS